MTRDECKELINELGIIGTEDSQIRISKSKITLELMESILFYTSKCRDKLSERIYWIVNNVEDYPFCQECGEQFRPRFYGFKTQYHLKRFCSPKCFANNEEVISKKKETCLEKFGTEYGWQSEEVKSKLRNTWEKNLGAQNPFQSPIVKEKIKETCRERFNVDYSFQSNIVKEKSKHTNLATIGYENAMQCPEIREKAMRTNMERYDVPHAMQNVDIFLKCQRNRFKKKKLVLPSGKIVIYQGYENVAIDKLLGQYLEEQIILEREMIPKIGYEFNGNKVYYPDLYIPHENLIIEVKSTWTYSKDLEQNKAKRQACLDAGYRFEFWICSDKEVMDIL